MHVSKKTSDEKIKSGTKLRVSPLKGILSFNLVTLVLAFISYISIDGLKWEIGLVFYLCLGIWLLVLVVTIFFFITSNYYIINADGVTLRRFNRDVTYAYRNIMFIDEEWSKKHKQIYLITKEGIEKFLPFDREAKVFNLMLANCPSLLSPEQAKVRFPQLRIKGPKEPKDKK